MVAPNPQTTGIKENPSARFVESVSSPITLFITPDRPSVKLDVEVESIPIFPLSSPLRHRLEDEPTKLAEAHKPICRQYLRTKAQKVRERPKASMDNVVPSKPIRITGFRPIWSEARLHWSTVIASVTKNRDS